MALVVYSPDNTVKQVYTDLAAYVTAVGSENRTIDIGKIYDITSDLTIPDNIVINNVYKGCGFNVAAGVTLTIGTMLFKGDYQCFYGDGNFLFGSSIVLNERMFGAHDDETGVNNALAINKMVACADVTALTRTKFEFKSKKLKIAGDPAISFNKSNIQIDFNGVHLDYEDGTGTAVLFGIGEYTDTKRTAGIFPIGNVEFDGYCRVTRNYTYGGAASAKLLGTGFRFQGLRNFTARKLRAEGFAEAHYYTGICSYGWVYDMESNDCLIGGRFVDDGIADPEAFVTDIKCFGGRIALNNWGFDTITGSRNISIEEGARTSDGIDIVGMSLENAAERKIYIQGTANRVEGCYLDTGALNQNFTAVTAVISSATTVAGSAVVTKVSHGVTPLINDILRVNSGTDRGWYRIQSYDTDTFTVDRALTQNATIDIDHVDRTLMYPYGCIVYNMSSTAGSAVLTKSSHGVDSLYGDMVEIVAGDSSDIGYYSVVSFDANTITLDRELAANSSVIEIKYWRSNIVLDTKAEDNKFSSCTNWAFQGKCDFGADNVSIDGTSGLSMGSINNSFATGTPANRYGFLDLRKLYNGTVEAFLTNTASIAANGSLAITARGKDTGGNIRSYCSLGFLPTASNGSSVTGDFYVNTSDGGSRDIRQIVKADGKIGFGVFVPKNKIDSNGNLCLGSTQAGKEIAPANGLMSQGNVVIGYKTNVVIAGDSSSQLSIMRLYGVPTSATYYWKLVFSGSDPTITVYSDVAGTLEVCSGSRVGDGVITLTESNSSGISGVIEITASGPTDDTDLAINTLTCTVTNASLLIQDNKSGDTVAVEILNNADDGTVVQVFGNGTQRWIVYGVDGIGSNDFVLYDATTAENRLKITPSGTTDLPNANVNITTGKSYQVDGTQVVTNRQIQAALANTANSGDANTDALITALKDIIIAHGLGASA